MLLRTRVKRALAPPVVCPCLPGSSAPGPRFTYPPQTGPLSNPHMHNLIIITCTTAARPPSPLSPTPHSLVHMSFTPLLPCHVPFTRPLAPPPRQHCFSRRPFSTSPLVHALAPSPRMCPCCCCFHLAVTVRCPARALRRLLLLLLPCISWCPPPPPTTTCCYCCWLLLLLLLGVHALLPKLACRCVVHTPAGGEVLQASCSSWGRQGGRGEAECVGRRVPMRARSLRSHRRPTNRNRPATHASMLARSFARAPAAAALPRTPA